MHDGGRAFSRLEVGDTADQKSALRGQKFLILFSKASVQANAVTRCVPADRPRTVIAERDDTESKPGMRLTVKLNLQELTRKQWLTETVQSDGAVPCRQSTKDT